MDKRAYYLERQFIQKATAVGKVPLHIKRIQPLTDYSPIERVEIDYVFERL